jgi:hypothetical protein
VGQSPAALQAAIVGQPVALGIIASSPQFKQYRGGIFQGYCGPSVDHAVLAVGYGQGYWKIKNS